MMAPENREGRSPAREVTREVETLSRVEGLVDRSGVRGKILNKVTDEEVAKLHNSANKLKEVIAQIEL